MKESKKTPAEMINSRIIKDAHRINRNSTNKQKVKGGKQTPHFLFLPFHHHSENAEPFSASDGQEASLCWVSSWKEPWKQVQVMQETFGCLDEVHRVRMLPPQHRYSLAVQTALPHAAINVRKLLYCTFSSVSVQVFVLDADVWTNT